MQNSTKPPLKDALEYEGARLSTFATYPDIPGIYATKLARAGFYYLGKGDEVVCFKCKFTHKNWKRHDSPTEIHKRISPLCDFIKQTQFMEYSQNVTVGASSNEHTNGTETQRIEHTNIMNQNPNSFNYNISHTHGVGIQSSPSVINQTFRNNTNTDITRTETYQNDNRYSTNSTDSLIRISTTHLSTRTSSSASNNHTLSQTISNDSTVASQASLEAGTRGFALITLSIQSMQSRLSRLDSFKHWPSYMTQSPEEMVSAGFFLQVYKSFFIIKKSNEDHCRCFFCGGGLRNWEPGDQPWTEHARWYQNCAFVRNCKGERFIQDVQTNNIQAQIVEKIELPNTITPVDDIRNNPAVRSVSQFDMTKMSVRSLEEENQNLKDQQTCKICLDEPIAIVFLPCGHLAACVTCAPALRRCPICRTFIKGTVKAIMC
ncbi:BIRC7_8 [Mytilus edulis]|uniref:BIRC7_8 n=1 Tax=Mytilus edulis TaxID=6550 RepID=A0A8S3UR03_MYTED|nr:BIRC7_8 [Mytilus edulis]